MVGEVDPTLSGLPEPGKPVFYPKVGHCIYRGVTEDRGAPGVRLLELEDMEEGSRILIPLQRVPELNLRPAGTALEEIKEVLSSEFQEPLPSDEDRQSLIEELISHGSPRSLSLALKRLHLLRQTTGLSREEEQTRKRIRSWLAAEVSISKECTRAEAQAFMTRVLQESMAAHRRKEKEEAKERRRAAKEQRKAEAQQEAEAEAETETAQKPSTWTSPEIETAKRVLQVDTTTEAELERPAESATEAGDEPETEPSEEGPDEPDKSKRDSEPPSGDSNGTSPDS